MTVGLLSLRNDDNNNITWLSLTNNEIGISIPDLTEALQKCGPRRSLRKVSCHAGFLGSLYNSDLKLLIETIAQLHNLQDLWLALSPKQSHLSKDIIQTILLLKNDNESPSSCRQSLKKLTIRGIDDAGCVMLAKALRRRNKPNNNGTDTVCNITELQIRGSVPATTTTNNNNNANATAGQVNSKVTRRGIMVIAHMLQTNRSLERVALCYKGLDTGCCKAFAKALRDNKTIQRLEITNPPNTKSNNNNSRSSVDSSSSLEEGYNILVQTMKTNYTLQHMTVPPLQVVAAAVTSNKKGAATATATGGGDHKCLLDLFTKLNRSGGRAILHNKSGQTTLDDVLALLQDNNNVSVLYEILSEMPALWDPFKASAVAAAATAASGLLLREDDRKPMATTTTKAKTSSLAPTTMRTTAAAAATNHVANIKQRQPPSPPPPQPQLPSSFANNNKPVVSRKPVMARWSEKIFADLEQEKIKTFVRWAPTLIEKEEDAASGVAQAKNCNNKNNGKGTKSSSASSRRKSCPPGHDMYYAPCMGLNQPVDPFASAKRQGGGGRPSQPQKPTWMKKRSATTGSSTSNKTVVIPPAAVAAAAVAAFIMEEEEDVDKTNNEKPVAMMKHSDIAHADTDEEKQSVATAPTPAAMEHSTSLESEKLESSKNVLAGTVNAKEEKPGAAAALPPSSMMVHSISPVSLEPLHEEQRVVVGRMQNAGADITSALQPPAAKKTEKEEKQIVGRVQNAADIPPAVQPPSDLTPASQPLVAKKTEEEEQRVASTTGIAADIPPVEQPPSGKREEEQEQLVVTTETGAGIPSAVHPHPSACEHSNSIVSARMEVGAEEEDKVQKVLGTTRNAPDIPAAIQPASVAAPQKESIEEHTSSSVQAVLEDEETKQVAGTTTQTSVETVPPLICPSVQAALVAALQKEATEERISVSVEEVVEDEETKILRQRLERKKKKGRLCCASSASRLQLHKSPAGPASLPAETHHDAHRNGLKPVESQVAGAAVASSAEIAKGIPDSETKVENVVEVSRRSEQKPAAAISSPAKECEFVFIPEECAPTKSTAKGVRGIQQQGQPLSKKKKELDRSPMLREWSSYDQRDSMFVWLPPKDENPALLREWKSSDQMDDTSTTMNSTMLEEATPSRKSLGDTTPSSIAAASSSSSRRPRKRIAGAAKKMWKGTKTLLHGLKAEMRLADDLEKGNRQ